MRFSVLWLRFNDRIVDWTVFHTGAARVTFLLVNPVSATNVIDRFILAEGLARSALYTFLGDHEFIHNTVLSIQPILSFKDI